MGKLYTSSAPWVVGREALLVHAVDDFLRAMTRQKPWLRARYEALLEGLDVCLSEELGRPAPLTAFNRERTDAWLRSLPREQHALAESALSDFADYLVKWGWLEAHSLRQPQAV